MAGFLARLVPAYQTFLNPDEALHLFLSDQASLRQAYEASLTTAHPPLMIMFLSLWRHAGRPELLLRLPFVLAATAFCWLMFLWVREMTGRVAAVYALALLAFSPSLISLSAEIRQYAPLLLFCAACLYLFDSAILRTSGWRMSASTVALYLALLTHYSSLIFALSMGMYGLVRLRFWRKLNLISVIWGAGQAGALLICWALFRTHVRLLRNSGLPTDIAETWLRSSIYQPHEDHLAHFLIHQTTRVFRFALSQGTIGFLALLFFAIAIGTLLARSRKINLPPVPCLPLALLLAAPFVVTSAAAVAGVYPYGGTRHDVLLVMFGLTGTAIGMAQLPDAWKKITTAVLVIALAVCNLAPFPTPPYILRKNQQKKLMTSAVDFIQKNVPRDATLVSDFEGGLLLGRYLCQKWIVPQDPFSDKFANSECNYRQTMVPPQHLWHFEDTNFASAWRQITADFNSHNDQEVWLFQAGWIDDKQDRWITTLRQYGCVEPHNFGSDIFLCRLDATLK